MVAVSSPPIGTSRWTTSTTETSGTGGALGASCDLHAGVETPAASRAQNRPSEFVRAERKEGPLALVMGASSRSVPGASTRMPEGSPAQQWTLVQPGTAAKRRCGGRYLTV